MSLLSPITPFDSEGVKWAKLQRQLRLAADNAGISYTMTFPLTDILPSDSEGIKWTKLGAWTSLLADGITPPAGGSGGVITSVTWVGSAILNEIFGYFRAPAATTFRVAQISAQDIPTGAAIIITMVNGAGVSLGVTATLASGSSFQETNISALALAAGGVVRFKFTQIGVTNAGGYITINLL